MESECDFNKDSCRERKYFELDFALECISKATLLALSHCMKPPTTRSP